MWRRWPGWRGTCCICIAAPSCSSCSPTRPGGQRRDLSEEPWRSATRWRSSPRSGAVTAPRSFWPALLLAVSAREYVRAVGRTRRARRIALQATAGLSLVLSGTAAARLVLPPGDVSGPSLLVYEAALCVLAGGLLAGLLVAPWQRAAVADLVVELGEAVPARSAASCPGRSATRRWRSATGFRTGACSSTPRAACSPFPIPVRALGDRRGARGPAGRRPGPRPGRAGRPGAAGGGHLRSPARGLERSAPGRGAGPGRGACGVAPADPRGTR